jgi:hypothetical protein
MEDSPRLPSPVVTLAQRAAPSPAGGHRLPDGTGEALHQGGVAVPPQWGEEGLDRLQGATPHAALPSDHAPAPYGLAHRRREPRRQRQPTRRRCGAWDLAPWRLPPGPRVGQQGSPILPEPIGEQPRGAVRGQPLPHVVDQALRHGERALPDVERQQPFPLGGQRAPAPLGRTLQAPAGRGLADRPVFDRAERGKERSALALPHAYLGPDVAGKRPELRCRFHEPWQDGVGGDLAHAGGAPATSLLGSAREDAHAALDGGALAVQARAAGLEQRAAPGEAPQLPPGPATRRASGAEMAPADPAPLGPGWMRAAMRGGLHLAAAASRHDDARWWGCRRGWARDTIRLPGVAMGLGGEARARFRLPTALGP